MREFEISLPPDADCAAVERFIDLAAAQSGLQTSLRGSLKKYPGCVHWHLKSAGASGTLEVTLWPRAHRAWFTIQSGRTAPWIDAAVGRMNDLLQRQLQGA